MIRSYKYLDSAVQLRLHEFIIAYFNRIEFETAIFDDSFFGADFLEIADRHPQILKQQCIAVYNHIKDWNQVDKTNLCSQIRDSNDIANICQGNFAPSIIDRHATGLNKLLRDLFLDLYNQVLDGDGFNEKYTTNLRTHFNDFSRLNSDITLCPICGIGELKKHTDLARDQYDHYLPKSIYPFSSVNFKNLVPICIDCNSTQVKGSKDVVALAFNHRLFYLYDTNHHGISVSFNITVDSINTENIQWQITFTNPDGKNDEIESWKTIYNIEGRYKGFVNGRIEKWFRHYWTYLTDSDLAKYSEVDRKLFYNKWMEKDEECHLNFIRKPALTGFLNDSVLSQASLQARQYSIPPIA
ncbi:MAG TPA: hypothetical protein DCG75_18610 [Bacteroidales bacterium]|nr:hypothetical protein [Bacteroidales bacterium]